MRWPRATPSPTRSTSSESAGRVLEVAEAKIIEADPALHHEKTEAERRSRFARLGRTDELGLRMLIARLDAADAVAVDATVCRVAEIIAPRHAEATPGVARIEGFGPVTLTRLAELLARCDLKIQPVKDLSHRVRYTAYEHPESLRDQVHLITGGDYSHNCGPLGRRHHRWKTHAGYQARQCGEGRYVWLSPNNLAFLVDHTGTHHIHPEKARMILQAPAGVDIYPS